MTTELLDPGRTTAGARSDRRLVYTAAGGVFLVAGLLFLAGFYPSPQNWGMHLLAFYPWPVRIGVPVLMLLMFVSPVRVLLVDCVARIAHAGARLPKSGRVLVSLGAMLAAGFVFWCGRTATHFLGDGYLCLRCAEKAGDNTALLLQTFTNEPLVGVIFFNLQSLLARIAGSVSAELTYRTLGVLSGVLFLRIVWYYSALISADRIDRMFLLFFLLASGASQLFFGYIENYAPAYVGTVLFFFTSLSFFRRRVSMFAPVLSFAVLVVAYFGAIIFTPVFLLVAWEGIRRGTLRSAIPAVAAGVALVPILLWLCGYTPGTLFPILTKGTGGFVPFTHQSTNFFMYTMFSPAHAGDVVNLLFLLQPAAFILLFSSVRALRRPPSGEQVFVILWMLCGAAFLCTMNCSLGMSRDWDLMAPFGAVFSTAGVYFWFQRPGRNILHRQLFAAWTAAAVLQTGVWIGINAGEARAVRRLNLLEQNPSWSIAAKCDLAEERGIYHRDRKEYDQAAAEFARASALQPLNVRYASNLGDVYMGVGETKKAIDALLRVESLGGGDAMLETNLGALYIYAADYNEAMAHLAYAEALDSTSALAPLNMGIAVKMRDSSYTRALPYFLKAIGRDSLCANAYLNAAICCEETGNGALAKKFRIRYVELSLGNE